MNPISAKYRVLIVDDDEYQLAALRRTLHGHFETVTTKDPITALRIFELQGPFAVVISDFQMPLMNGVQLFTKIFEMNSTSQRILITGHADLQMAIDAVNHGKITAFLTKPAQNASLRAVVCDAVQTYKQMLEATVISPGHQASSNNVAACSTASLDIQIHLTLKEIEVLLLLAKGFSNQEISTALQITVGTVKTHVISLLSKLNVNNRTKAVTRALELGLINSTSSNPA